MQKQRSTSDPDFPHGTTTGSRYGCHCAACRAANAEASRKYYATHREEVRERMRNYHAAHREEDRERSRDYYVAHREEVSAYKRNYHAAHREEKAEYDRSYRAAHREERAKTNREWRTEHREEDRRAKRKWNANHPEKCAALERTRRARKRGNGGRHTAADIRAQYQRQKGRCYYCGRKVDDNYHVDHVVPLALGGSNGPENLVIACAHCNDSKGARHPMEFAGVMF